MTPYRHICFLVLFVLAYPRLGSTTGPRAWTTYQNMDYVTSFAEGDREVYVGTTGGVRRFNLFTGKEGKPLTTAEGLRDNRVLRMAYDRRMGDLYVDTPAGVDRFGIESETVFPSARFPSESADEAPGPNGGFPLDSLLLQPGLFLQDGWIRDRHFRTYRITGHLFDRWSHIWVGTWGLGVGMADVRQQILNLMPYGPAENNVTAFLADGDDLWIGGIEGGISAVEARERGLRDSRVGDPGGITRHCRRDGTWTTYEPGEVFGLDDSRVFSIVSDEANIWFATQDGLVRYQKRNGIWRTYKDFQGIRGTQVTDAIRDGNRLWIGTPTGLGLLDVDADSTVSISGGKNTYVYDLERAGGFLWAATSRGVFRCPEGKASWKRFEDQEGHLSGEITASCARGREIWFCVLSPPSLLQLDGDDCRVAGRFPVPELTGRPIAALAADSSYIWAATEIGAMRLDQANGTWRRFTRSDGLLSDQVQAILLETDGIWFGTMGGISHLVGNGD